MALHRAVKEVEDYLTPSEAGRLLGNSGAWVKQLVKRGDLEGIETHLGWLIKPESVERLAEQRLEQAERKVSTLKAASSHGQTKGAKKLVLFPAGLCRANASEKGPESPIQGTREIDPTDPDMAERYGFVQEPIEAEIIEERPEP